QCVDVAEGGGEGDLPVLHERDRQLEPVPSHAHENRNPARADRRDGGVDGMGVAGGIDVAVEMLFELCEVRLLRVDGAACAMFRGEAAAVLHRVADHYL